MKKLPDQKIKDLKTLRSLLRNLIKHGKAGPHSSKKADKGYKRHQKHRGKDDDS